MAYSDWTFLPGNDSGTNTAAAYSPGGALTPPTGVTPGSYARYLSTVGTSNAYCGLIPASSSFTGVPSTKAIRVQSLAYFAAPGAVNFCSFYIGAKVATANLPGNSGYGLWGDSYNNLWFRNNQNGQQVQLESEGSMRGTWRNLRVSVYPVSATVDRVICEKETSLGSGTWTSTFGLRSGDFTIDQTATPNAYAPWGGSRVNGVFATCVGFAGQPAIAYIDLTSVELATVPVPIP